MLKKYIPPTLMQGSNMNAGLDPGPIQLGAVPVWCWARVSGYFDTSTMWSDSLPDTEDYSPFILDLHFRESLLQD